MAYDEQLADRVRAALGGADERRMFGGLAFLLGGHLTVAVSGQGGLMVRVDAEKSAALVAAPDVERMVMQGRELAGWLYVAPSALTSDDDLQAWLGRAVEFVRTLPPKTPAADRPQRVTAPKSRKSPGRTTRGRGSTR